MRTKQGGLRLGPALLILITAASLGACGSGGGQPKAAPTGKASGAASTAPPATEEPGSPNAVTMKLIAFRPDKTMVAVGTEVTWTQMDPGLHTVTSGTVVQSGGGVTTQPDGKFSSQDLATGETFSFKFDQPGTYPYFCKIHPATMRGEVTVTG